MHRCEFCGSELPPNAHFCGICGQMQNDETKSATQITTLSEPRGTAPDTPPVFSNPSLPIAMPEPTGQQDAGATVSSGWSYLLPIPQNPPLPDERQTEESRALPLELILPLSAVEFGQLPPGQSPMVPGTPQVGQVPTIQGTPSTPAGHSPGYAGAHNVVPSAPPHVGSAAQSWQPFSPAHQQAHHPSTYHPQPTGPVHPPQHPTAPPRRQQEPEHEHPARHHRHEHEHEHAHHRTEPSKAQRTHRLRLHSSHTHATHVATASKVAVGTATKWLIVAVAAVVVAATSGVVFVLASAPGLSLSGSSAVSTGGTLHIHGKGFLPGGSVSLTLDHGLPVAFDHTGMVDHAGHEPAMSADALFTLGHSASRASSNFSVPVGVAGSFDADLLAQTFWSPGQHTIHARENLGSRSADLQFTVLPSPAKLVVKPASLTYKVQAGARAIQALEISNAGQASLNWTAATDGSNWLKLQGSSGNIGTNGSGEFIDVTADASHLKVGSYTATIQVNTNAGNAQVAVTLIVLSPAAKKQAQLNVNSTTLDFGQLMTNQQVTRPVSVGNLGTADLHWNASTGNASWLTLDTTSGTVQAGATPQIIQASVNTSSLAPGSYSDYA